MKLYKECIGEDLKFKELRVKRTVKIRAMLTGFLFAFVLFLIPFLAVINLFLFYIYIPLLIAILTILCILMGFSYYYFFFEALKNYDSRAKDINTRKLVLYNGVMLSIFIITIAVVIVIVIKSLKLI